MNDQLMEIERRIYAADGYRELRDFTQAANAYRDVLAIAPDRADIWVQLGNMEKDAGRFAEARHAYQKALELGADAADTLLQLGRAHRLAGETDLARQTFLKGLDTTPTPSRDLARELVALGESWAVQQRIGLGLPSTIGLCEAVIELKAIAEHLERLVPDAARLSAFPLERYDLYRKFLTVPPPVCGEMSAAAPKFALIIFVPTRSLPAALECLASLKRQSSSIFQATFVCAEAAASDSLNGYLVGNDDNIRCRLSDSAIDGWNLAEAAAIVAGFGADDWIILLDEPVILDTHAVAWLIAASKVPGARFAFCDEDVASRDRLGGWRRSQPLFRAACDPEMLDQGISLGTMVAASRSDMLAAMNACLSRHSTQSAPSLISLDLHRCLAAGGGGLHVPEVLVSRLSAGPCTQAGAPSKTQPITGSALIRSGSLPGNVTTICVIIPTKDQVELLKLCISSLRGTASRNDLLELVVVDNGSSHVETAAYLRQGADSGLFRVKADICPFNWSRINNAAAATASAECLVFVNNDIEMLSPGWDDIVRQHLSRAEIGAIGARLLYPDRTIQHAGIVLGVGEFGAEHEGRNRLQSDGGPANRWRQRRTVSAVTGAWLACRRLDFVKLRGFDAEMLPIWFNDVDFCLRLSAIKLRVIYEPEIEAIHHESKTLATEFCQPSREAQFLAAFETMRRRWGERLHADPYYNPHFARWCEPFAALTARSDAGLALLASARY